jgi:hypothetical protein
MAKIMLRVYIGSVKVNEIRIDILGIVPDECVLLVAFVKFKMLLK